MGLSSKPRYAVATAISVLAVIAWACSTPGPTPNPKSSSTPTPQPDPSPSSSTLAPCAETCSCTIHLSWDAPASSSDPVAGYYIYWGTTQGGPYPNQWDAMNNTQTSISNFCAGDYYFIAKSYDAQGNQSTPSNEAGVPVNNNSGAVAQVQEMHIHVGDPGAALGQQNCNPQDNLVNQMRQLIAPANQAAQAEINPPVVHPTVRIVGVTIDGAPSDAAIGIAQSLCDEQQKEGQHDCEFTPSQIPDPAPQDNWTIEVQWSCDHTPFPDQVNRIAIRKDSQGTLALYCGSW